MGFSVTGCKVTTVLAPSSPVFFLVELWLVINIFKVKMAQVLYQYTIFKTKFEPEQVSI